MARWFRFYDEALNDPKVQKLPGPLFKTWINLLCLASARDGALPPVEDIAFSLRIGAKDAAKSIDALTQAGLIDVTGDGFTPHNWSGRQYAGDSAAERMRRHRQRKRDVTGDVTGDVTPPSQLQKRDGADSDTDSDTEQNRTEQIKEEPAPPAAPPPPDDDLTVPAFLERKTTPRQELETVLDGEHAQAVIEHRQRMRKPLTPHAAKLLAAKFSQARGDPNLAADAMIAGGWQGFEPQWMENRTRQGHGYQNRPSDFDNRRATVDAVDEVVALAEARRG